VLLVRARKRSNGWVFPKGTVQAGESRAAAALREAREEAGVSGVVIGPAGPPVIIESGRDRLRVSYYLMRVTAETESPEKREKRWCTIGEALDRLPAGAQRLLLGAQSEIRRFVTSARSELGSRA
jgi:8-oxo-dGTP diphosphatase